MERTLQSISDDANEVGFSKQRAEGETEPFVRPRRHRDVRQPELADGDRRLRSLDIRQPDGLRPRRLSMLSTGLNTKQPTWSSRPRTQLEMASTSHPA